MHACAKRVYLSVILLYILYKYVCIYLFKQMFQYVYIINALMLQYSFSNL